MQKRVHNWFVAPNYTRQTTLRNCKLSKVCSSNEKAKLCAKDNAQLSRIVRKLKPVPNTVRHCPVARNWRKVINLRTTSKCRFRLSLYKTACANVLLLQIGVETLCTTVVLLEIGAMCKQAKNCAKQIAQLKISLNWLVWSVWVTTNLKEKASSVKKVKKTTP